MSWRHWICLLPQHGPGHKHERQLVLALDLLGIPWRQSSWKMVSVSRREAVERLDALIGPKR